MSKRKIKIGLAGLYFESKNLGCMALALSFYKGLVEVLKVNNIKVDIVSFSAPVNTSFF